VRLLVCGGRHYGATAAERDALYMEISRLRPHIIINGGAEGADELARAWAHYHGKLCLTYPAEWRRYGRAAGPMRNQRMLDEGQPDALLAAPGSRGTADMVRRARACGLPVYELLA
jgi:hypothetical protein